MSQSEAPQRKSGPLSLSSPSPLLDQAPHELPSRLSYPARHRRIVGPIRAAAWPRRAPFASPKVKGLTGKGVTYEKKVRARVAERTGAFEMPTNNSELLKDLNAQTALPLLMYFGLWISYVDKNGTGIAQPDIILLEGRPGVQPYDGPLRMWWAQPEKVGHITLIECKLTQLENGYAQMEELYVPLLQFLFPSVPIARVQACKWADPDVEPGELVSELSEVPMGCKRATWHYLA